MPWEFEKVYEAAVSSSPKQMLFDGRYLWVTTDFSVLIYEFFGESSDHEPTFEELDQLVIDRYDAKIKLIETIPVPNGAYWIARGNRNTYIGNAAMMTSISIINNSTRKVDRTVTLPEEMNSNLIVADRYIWMASKSPKPSSDRQLLWRWDGSNGWADIEIPTRKQLARIVISQGNNGSLYLTNFNNVAICKFDVSNGAFQKAIRTNAFPQNILTTSNRDIYVSSFAGMLSKVDGSTDSVTHPHSTLDVAVSMAYQPNSNYIWFLNSNGRLGRLNTADNSVFFSKPKETLVLEDDWELSLSKFSDQAFSSLLITPEFSYKQLIGGTWKKITVKPYLIVLGGSKIMAVRLDRPLYRGLDISVQARAMISTGPEDYMGEIG